MRPRFVVTNPAYEARFQPASPEAAFVAGLQDGSLGYRLALDHRQPPALAAFFDAAAWERAGRVNTNLARIDPRIRVYERAAP